MDLTLNKLSYLFVTRDRGRNWHRPIQLTQCCDQFKPFGNKTFSFRNFIIIIIIIIIFISLFFTANFTGYSRLLGEETSRNHQAYRWFSRYVIAAMLVDGKQKIAH